MIPGLIPQIPRITKLIFTPAALAAYSASITSFSIREFILAQMRAAGAAIGEGDIVEESVRTPDDWESLYALEHGAAFGLAHPLAQLGYFRPANKDARTDGLYYVGASTHPGNGVPLCLISARLAVERVLEDL